MCSSWLPDRQTGPVPRADLPGRLCNKSLNSDLPRVDNTIGSGPAIPGRFRVNTINRRRHERFSLLPMYTPIEVRGVMDDSVNFHGHVYDVSEGGIRFELDEPVVPGTAVSLFVTLPGSDAAGQDRSVQAFANVVWVDDDQDEPGPVRMAAAFTRFARAGDLEKLIKQLSSGRFARAA